MGPRRIPAVVEVFLPQTIRGELYIKGGLGVRVYESVTNVLQRFLSKRLLMPIGILQGCLCGLTWPHCSLGLSFFRAQTSAVV